MSADPNRIGARLRFERKTRRLTVDALAEAFRDAASERDRQRMPRLQDLRRTIRGYEAGEHVPGDRNRMLYAAVFGIAEDDLFGDGDESVRRSPNRRNVLALGAAAGAALPISRGGKMTVAPELVDYFRDQLPGHYRAEMFLGPHLLIPTVTAQTRLISDLAESAPQTVRRPLLDIGAAYAALLGWLYQDAGDLGWSRRWRDVALELAHRSGNPQLISYALSNKAQLATDLGDGAAVVDFAQAALDEEKRLCPKVRILALQHQAHGWSLVGDRSAADRLIDQASTLTDHADDGYPWANAYRRTPHYLEVQRATAYSRIGDSAAPDAVRLWDQILGAMPESARRDNAVFWVRQATALAVIPEPERVVRIAAVAARLTSETGSARLVRELMRLPGCAAEWADSAHGRELGEILDAVRALDM